MKGITKVVCFYLTSRINRRLFAACRLTQQVVCAMFQVLNECVGANNKWTAAAVAGHEGPTLYVPENSVRKGSVVLCSVKITLSGQDVPLQRNGDIFLGKTDLTENEVNFTFQPSVVLGSIKLPLSGQDVPCKRCGNVFQSQHYWSAAYLPKMG